MDYMEMVDELQRIERLKRKHVHASASTEWTEEHQRVWDDLVVSEQGLPWLVREHHE